MSQFFKGVSMRNQLILCTFVASLFGCSGSMQFVNKQYNYDPDSSCISLLPLTKDALIISNRKDVHDDFKNDSREAEAIITDTSYKYLYKVIVDSINTIENVEISSSACSNWTQNAARFFSYHKKIGKDSTLISFNVMRREHLDTLSTKANILIFINKLAITRNAGSAGSPRIYMGGGLGGGLGGGMWVGGGGGKMSTFDANVQYIIWDYRKNEPISCGEFTSKAGIFIAATDDTWKALFKSIGNQLISTTPFRGKIKKNQ